MEVKITLLLAALFLLLTSPTFTATVLGASSNVAEEFSNYKLALQWPNSVCNVGVPCSKTAEKIKTDYQRFVIHGLWAFWANNSVVACLGNDNDFLTRGQVKDIKKSLEHYWPTLLHLPDGDFSFWKSEWKKHGRCLGLDQPSMYFNDAIDLRKRFVDDLGLGGQDPRIGTTEGSGSLQRVKYEGLEKYKDS